MIDSLQSIPFQTDPYEVPLNPFIYFTPLSFFLVKHKAMISMTNNVKPIKINYKIIQQKGTGLKTWTNIK